jgi:hypothetical protein
MLNPLTKLLGVMKGIAAIGGIEAASEALGTVSQVKTVNRANREEYQTDRRGPWR